MVARRERRDGVGALLRVRVGGLCCALLFMNREEVGGWCDMIMIGDGGLVIVVLASLYWHFGQGCRAWCLGGRWEMGDGRWVFCGR